MLAERYRDEVMPALMQRFGYANRMQVPAVKKVVLNIGVGEAPQDAKTLDAAVAEMAAISGQKPVVTRAKRSIANFKIRKGMPIGCSVTLRGRRMYDFLERLVTVALPRVRDFRGVPGKGLDGRGNYNLGIREQLVFPEIDYDKVVRVRGMGITIVTSARTDEEAKGLLAALGMPFADR